MLNKKDFLKYASKLAFPIMIQNLIGTLVNIADTVMLGYVSQTAMSASSLANQYTSHLFLDAPVVRLHRFLHAVVAVLVREVCNDGNFLVGELPAHQGRGEADCAGGTGAYQKRSGAV